MENQFTHRLEKLESEVVGLRIHITGIKASYGDNIRNLQSQIQDLHAVVSSLKLNVDPPNMSCKSKKKISIGSPITPKLKTEQKKEEVMLIKCFWFNGLIIKQTFFFFPYNMYQLLFHCR